MDKPDVESIEGLSPAISIDQKTTSHNPRSTVGTVTEIHDYLRLLFARVGTAYCPQSEEERWRLVHAGFDLDRIYTLEELCRAEDTHFAATGITDGPFLRGVRYKEGQAWTESLVIRGATRTLRKVEAWHRLEKLRGISPVAY